MWANSLRYARNIYATINERDRILGFSDVINADRLGNTAEHYNSHELTYFDLTDGDGVKKKHQHFGSTAEDNAVVNAFFNAVFEGRRALPIDGAQQGDQANVFTLV